MSLLVCGGCLSSRRTQHFAWALRKIESFRTPSLVSNHADNRVSRVDYFNIPYMLAGGGEQGLRGNIETVAEPFVASAQTGQVTPAQVAKASQLLPNTSLPYVQELSAQTQTTWNKIATTLSPDRARFFQAHLLLHVTIQVTALTAQDAICRAVLTLARGDHAGAANYTGTTVAALESMFAAMRTAETGAWRGLFLYDRLDDFQRTRTIVRQAQAALAGAKSLPPTRPESDYTAGRPTTGL